MNNMMVRIKVCHAKCGIVYLTIMIKAQIVIFVGISVDNIMIDYELFLNKLAYKNLA